jgi:hypothetical protein
MPTPLSCRYDEWNRHSCLYGSSIIHIQEWAAQFADLRVFVEMSAKSRRSPANPAVAPALQETQVSAQSFGAAIDSGSLESRAIRPSSASPTETLFFSSVSPST